MKLNKITFLFLIFSLSLSLVSACVETEEQTLGSSSSGAPPEGYNPYAVVGDNPDAGISYGGENPAPETAPDATPANTAGSACDNQQDLSELPTCCEYADAHCLPMSFIPEGLQDMIQPCSDEEACVPDDILNSMRDNGGYTPKTCQSLNGEGRCISLCIPMVADFKDLLPQDVCKDNERCTPCINPLDNTETGACAGSIECSDIGDSQPPDDPPPVDDKPPADPCVEPPNIDPNTFPQCPCAGTRCVPNALVTPEQQQLLAPCSGGFCVPEGLVSTGGYFTPKTCVSIGNSEGRCLSTCIPQVAEKADQLPQDVCDANEACSPCCDPFTGEDTGACSQGCDVGPAEACGEPIFPTCCNNGDGHCLDPALVPSDKHDQLNECGETGNVCVPDVMQDDNFKGAQCMGYMWLTGKNYAGVCLPQCLKLPAFFLDATACPQEWICVPCIDPFGQQTGAPGC